MHLSLGNASLDHGGAAASGPPEEELLMWKPASIEKHNLEIIRKKINEKYQDAKLENYHDLHR